MIERGITENLLAALADSPVVLLNGARQSGKSTLVHSLQKTGYSARYITLDDMTTLAAVRHDPQGFLAGQPGALIIDEIQRAPELFIAIKASVDSDRRPGRFLLTGSANVLLLPTLSESLAGRMEILTLWPFSQGEMTGVREHFVDALFADTPLHYSAHGEDRELLLEKVISGGYPEVLTRSVESRRRAWFASYLTTILQRDIRELANIEGLTALPRLLAILATRSTAQLNYAELSRTVGITQTTLKRYMALLEMTFLVRQIPAWSSNLGKRLVKTAKLVLNDTGLMAYLLGVNQQRIQSDTLLGPFLENFVAMELLKQMSWSSTLPQLFHYRTQAGKEVDFVLEDASGRVVGIEVKSSSTLGASDFAGLKDLSDQAGNRFVRGVVLYTGTQMIPFGRNLVAMPLSALWMMK